MSPLILEITIISAQGIKNASKTLFSSHRLRPFVTITTFPPPSPQPSSCKAIDGEHEDLHVYRTNIDERGGSDPTWGDKFHIPLHPTFFTDKYSCIYLFLYTKRLMLGWRHLGWCQIPATDIFNGLSPPELVHHLSYRLRAQDGTRGHGTLNVAVKLIGAVVVPGCPPQRMTKEIDTCQSSIGIPVSMCPVKRPWN